MLMFGLRGQKHETLKDCTRLDDDDVRQVKQKEYLEKHIDKPQ